MCITTPLQQKIIDRTDEGDTIAAFLVDTMRGKTPGVKVCHRMDAAKHLIKYGFPEAECDAATIHSKSIEGRAKTPSPSTGEGWDGGEDSPSSMSAPVTHLDILNYQIAHLIRHETAEGHTLVEFLIHIMTGRDRPFTPKKFRIKPADRIAAARELLRRGFGDLGSRRRLSDITDEANAYDTLHTDLARRMREYSERGTDTVRFLLEVMSDPDPDLEFTIHHRMSAAQELLRRGWDTNYDAVKPKHLQDYWRDDQSPRLTVGQKKTLAGFTTSIDDYDNYDDTDYEAIAKDMREEEDREAAASKSLHPRYGKIRTGVTEPVSKSLPLSESGDETISESNNIEDKNIYDYGRNDPDPEIDYYFEPLNPEEQALFDYEARLESGDFPKGKAPKEPPPPPPSAYAEYSDTLRRIKDAAAREGVPVLPNPLAGKLHAVKIRSP